jgi:hypothetical protein
MTAGHQTRTDGLGPGWRVGGLSASSLGRVVVHLDVSHALVILGVVSLLTQSAPVVGTSLALLAWRGSITPLAHRPEMSLP